VEADERRDRELDESGRSMKWRRRSRRNWIRKSVRVWRWQSAIGWRAANQRRARKRLRGASWRIGARMRCVPQEKVPVVPERIPGIISVLRGTRVGGVVYFPQWMLDYDGIRCWKEDFNRARSTVYRVLEQAFGAKRRDWLVSSRGSLSDPIRVMVRARPLHADSHK